MESSDEEGEIVTDEEGEIVTKCVTDYYFETLVNGQKEPVSFSAIPLQWGEGKVQGECETLVFLLGRVDDGFPTLHVRALAWNFDISDVHPQIAVLAEDRNWIILLDPRKCFENVIRTTLVTVHWLHFVKRNPEASDELIWSHLLRVFGSYEVQPSEGDLLDQMQLIKEVAERDVDLAKSKGLISFMDNLRTKKPIEELSASYIFSDVQTTQKPEFMNENEEAKDDAVDDDDVQSPMKPAFINDKDDDDEDVLTTEKHEFINENGEAKDDVVVDDDVQSPKKPAFINDNDDDEDVQTTKRPEFINGNYEAKYDVINDDENVQTPKKLEFTNENDEAKDDVVVDDDKDVQTTKKPELINENNEAKDDVVDDDDEESNFFDTVCTICDNGGEVLGCQGSCMRSFHASKDTGADSACQTLGYSRSEVETMENFLCKNCLYNQHQCFACGILGSSDVSSGAEVFPCIAGGCGRFYHPECVAKLLYLPNETEAEQCAKIAAGEVFTCPSHKCYFCKEFENKNVHELQLAMCRRCPKSYHRKCLPKAITFVYNGECFPRAWDGLLPNNRILIYCLKHKIVDELGTPERNHIVFPEAEARKKKYSAGLKLSKEKVALQRSVVHAVKAESINETYQSTKKVVQEFSRQDSYPLKKQKLLDVTRKPFKDKSKLIPEKVSRFVATDESKLSHRKSSSSFDIGSHLVKSKQPTMVSKNAISAKPMLGKTIGSRSLVDVEMQKGILALMKNSTASYDVEDFNKRHGIQSKHTSSTSVLDKTLTEGKMEMSVKAVRAALEKIESGGSIEDAKAICEPDLLRQIFRWKSKLNVYLSPFLVGKRYTSFGRHFTKLDKLKEIVNRLHWYVQEDDMIVDFCCGSNDFSCLMKEKLEKMGKRCLFKNYDLIQAKNDFSFERRDWMDVKDEELPNGSKLIMGLNPPFGVKASLANKFINKALQFKPKLLILIVPKETHRLDRKAAGYDLIWEDDMLLSGKSFYLPGSVDVNDKQLEDWNLKPPPLYLWSRPDWTVKHLEIAQERSHISEERAMDIKNWVIENRNNNNEAEWRGSNIASRLWETTLNEKDQSYGSSPSLPPPPPWPPELENQILNENDQSYGSSPNLPPPPPWPPELENQNCFQTCHNSINFPSPTPPSPSFSLPPPPLLESPPSPPPPPPPLESYPSPPPPPPPVCFPSPTPSTPSPSTKIDPDAGGWICVRLARH